MIGDEGGEKKEPGDEPEREARGLSFFYSPLSEFWGALLPFLLHPLGFQRQSAPCISNKHPDLSLLPSFSSGGPYHPAECCLTYVSRPVPRQRVSSYYETSSQCPKPGIV